jgi:hypothetical protein
MVTVIHIDRLRLKGFGSIDGAEVAAGLRQELGRLLVEPGAIARLRSLASVPRLKVNRIQIEHDTAPGQIGERVASGIGGGFAR